MTPGGRPDLVVVGEIYRLIWPFGIEAELERIAEHKDELTAEVTMRTSRPPSPGLLHSARFNLMSTQARRTLSQSLRERDPDLDWAALVEQMCFLVRERYRNGEPPIDLREALPAEPRRWLVEPFVENEGATVLFADGGTGKSLAALAIAVTVASGCSVLGHLYGEPAPTLYLDWETSRDTMQERLDAIAAGAHIRERPEIYYRRMTASLVESAANVRRDIAKLGIAFVVIDSLGAARAGEPESADMTIRLFNAARSLGVPWLGVDHVTKSTGNDSARPFGSTYTHNLARLTWSMDKSQDEGEDSLILSLTNRKRNNGRLFSPQGYRLTFTTTDDRLTSVEFRHQDLTQTALAGRVPLKQRILAELRGGPLEQPALAERLGADPVQVRARVNELAKAEKVVRLDDHRVALLTQRTN